MGCSEILISIVIPIFNGEKYIRRCLDSIVNQNNDNIEIILVNDGSTDSTKKICEKYQEKYSNIMLINNLNKGVSYSRNIGVENSRGKYIFFLDIDDYLPEDSIEKMLDKIDKYDIIRFSYSISDNNKSKNIIYEEKDFVFKDFNSKKEYLKNFISNFTQNVVWGQLIKHDLLIDTKFDENLFFGEDLLYNYELYTKATSIKNSSDIVYIYEQSEGSITKNFSNKKVYDKIMNLISIFEMVLKKENDLEIEIIVKERFLKEIIPQIMMLCFDIEIKKAHVLQQYKIILNHNIFNTIFDRINLKNYKYKTFYKIMKAKNVKLMYIYSKLYKIVKNKLKKY